MVLEDNIIVSDNLYISVHGDNCVAHIGANALIGDVNMFLEESNTEIIIGRDCMFGFRNSLATTDFHSITDLEGHRINPARSIRIGDHVWLSSTVDIGKGVEIARDSVVASNSVVTKRFATPNVILAGIPARIVKEGINWSSKRL